MKVIILRELKANRKSLLIWMAGMLVMVGLGAMEYPTLVKNAESIAPMMDMFPRIMRVIFGMDIVPVTTPLGYYVCLYLWYCIVAFMHSAVLGATIIAKEERDRTSEFLFTKPYSRDTFIAAKLIAAVLNVAVITLTTWVLNLITIVPQIQGVDILPEINITILGMFFAQLIFLSVGLLFSGICKHHGKALTLSISFVLFAYVLSVIIEFSGNINFLSVLTPFQYFFAPIMVYKGIDLPYFLLSVILIGAFTFVTFKSYRRRELHN